MTPEHNYLDVNCPKCGRPNMIMPPHECLPEHNRESMLYLPIKHNGIDYWIPVIKHEREINETYDHGYDVTSNEKEV